MQQPVLQVRARDLDAVGQHEAALELARGDAAVQEDPALRVVALAAADHQLVVLECDREVVLAEAGHGQRDAVGGVAALLDVVGRIPVVAGLGGAFHQPVELLEPQKIGMRGEGHLGHVLQALVSSDSRRGPVRRPRIVGNGERARQNKGLSGTRRDGPASAYKRAELPGCSR